VVGGRNGRGIKGIKREGGELLRGGNRHGDGGRRKKVSVLTRGTHESVREKGEGCTDSG
jgi:hypothetical protein